jgi:serine/threonine protein kinase
MLEKDPNKRITISEIMLHPWISKYKEQKMKKEWGYYSSSSSNESLVLEDEISNNQTTTLTLNDKNESR